MTCAAAPRNRRAKCAPAGARPLRSSASHRHSRPSPEASLTSGRRPRLRSLRPVAACSRGARPSVCTCETACWPSPGFRCRRRRHGFRYSCHCRPLRPTAWIPAASARRVWPARTSPPRHRRPWRRRSRPPPSRSVRAHPQVPGSACRPMSVTCPASGVRASASARPGRRSTGMGLRPWRSVRPGGDWRHPSQRCLLSRAMACSISSAVRMISGRMAAA